MGARKPLADTVEFLGCDGGANTEAVFAAPTHIQGDGGANTEAVFAGVASCYQ